MALDGLTRIRKRRIWLTLPFGNSLLWTKSGSKNGTAHGEVASQDGTSSALPCQSRFSAKLSTYTPGEWKDIRTILLAPRLPHYGNREGFEVTWKRRVPLGPTRKRSASPFSSLSLPPGPLPLSPLLLLGVH